MASYFPDRLRKSFFVTVQWEDKHNISGIIVELSLLSWIVKKSDTFRLTSNTENKKLKFIVSDETERRTIGTRGVDITLYLWDGGTLFFSFMWINIVSLWLYEHHYLVCG